MKALLLTAVLLAAVGNATAQDPAGAMQPVIRRHNVLVRAVQGVGHEFVDVFRDVKRDPLWAAYVFAGITANALDAGSTAAALRNPKVHETNFLEGPHPSLPRLISTQAGFTLGELLGNHYIRRKITEKCERDAADPDPNSRWNRTPARSHNPQGCNVAGDIIALSPLPVHALVIKDNIDIAGK